MTPARLRARITALLHLDDPPWRIALALAIGVFISCTPFYFFQTLLAVLVATVFRLNTAATVAGTWLNLPWFAPFVYAGALQLGGALIGADSLPVRALAAFVVNPASMAWRDALVLLRETSLALLVGTTIVGLVAGALTYVIAVRLIASRRRRREAVSRSDRRRAA
jgi:uncharacterized protein (DUF2062 family)